MFQRQYKVVIFATIACSLLCCFWVVLSRVLPPDIGNAYPYSALVFVVAVVTTLIGLFLIQSRTHEALALFRKLIDGSSDSIEVIDPKTGRFLDVNFRGCADLGYSRSEFLRLSVYDIDPSVTKESFARYVVNLREKGSLRWEGIHKKKGGYLFPVEVSLQFVKLDQEYIVASVRDIAVRKTSEESNLKFSTIVEQAAETIMVTDENGKIIFVNPAFERVSGYSKEEVIGKSPTILKSGKQAASVYQDLWNTLKHGKVWHGHFINRKKNGTLYEEDASISPVKDSSGKVINYVAVKRDVTRVVELEEQVRQTQKLHAIGQLASGVAHDFNNILAVIQLQAGVLKDAGGTPKHLEMAHEIERAAQRAAELTRQLLIFSRRGAWHPVDVDLNEVVTNTSKMLQRILGEQIRLNINLHTTDLGVYADSGMVEQVLVNLAVNAKDAMPKGGKLTISTSKIESKEAHADLPAGHYACLTVTDTGIGIAPEILPRIYEPFFTTKAPGKGTGLGLATVFGIIQQHKGWVDVKSEVGSGTTFSVYIPLLLHPLPAPVTAKTSLMMGGHETILLVEDDQVLCSAIKNSLIKLGYTVYTAHDGTAALNVWNNQKATVDLLLTDIGLPHGFSGLDLGEQLIKDKPSLKVLFSSGYSPTNAATEMLVDGVNLICKPFETAKLALLVRNLLDS